MAALLVAAKYEEIYPPEIKDLLAALENKFTKPEILEMEQKILSTLEFDFFVPSSYRFLQRYQKISTTATDDKIFFFAQYLSEVCLLDTFFLQFPPSKIAAATFMLSAKSVKGVNAWNGEMEKWSGINASSEEMTRLITEFKKFLEEINAKFLPSLQYKFNKDEYLQVAKIPFKF